MNPVNTIRGALRRPNRFAWMILVGGSLLTVFVACQAITGLFLTGDSGPVFPHLPHNEEGMDCTDCHATAEDGVLAGMPQSAKGCMLCHKDIDGDKPEDRRVAAFVVDGVPVWLARPNPYAGEVQFNHGAHAEAELDCEACHAPETDGTGRELRLAGGKRRCVECHAETERGNDCSVCHKVLRKDSEPPDHGGSWIRLHGIHSRERIQGLGQTGCVQCHQESSCTQCHQEQQPASHTNFWRVRGHGLTAAMDRTNCATCHRTDFCVRCHNDTQPMSHRGGFAAPTNRHCASCHLPARGLGCATCHANFPAHVDGPMMPANAPHVTASSPVDCLSCHLALRHPNPGGDCRTCHK